VSTMNNNIDIEIKKLEDIAVVVFNTASISDAAGIGKVSAQIKQFVADNRPKKMVIDFVHVKFFTSQALGLLLDIWRKLQENSGEVVISGINPQLHRVFKITNLDKIFRFFPDEQTALKAFDSNTQTREG
ncbi:MAG: STAS domain-containing protein, partial [Sedimentisphaerales bacterium]|nr:STAS domain-containing protein [Sedimentisphaerales bacterium]